MHAKILLSFCLRVQRFQPNRCKASTRILTSVACPSPQPRPRAVSWSSHLAVLASGCILQVHLVWSPCVVKWYIRCSVAPTQRRWPGRKPDDKTASMAPYLLEFDCTPLTGPYQNQLRLGKHISMGLRAREYNNADGR